jgi:hypothetical protein
MISIFSNKEIKIINNYKNGVFESIQSKNYDESIHIDVFDLYKSDTKDVFLVVEDGNTRHEDGLKNCLDYIHVWL